MFLQKFPPWAVAELKSAIEAAPAAATVTTRDGGGCRRTCSIPEVFPELLRCSNRPGPPGGVREMKNLFMDTFTLLSILISTTELKGVKKLRMAKEARKWRGGQSQIPSGFTHARQKSLFILWLEGLLCSEDTGLPQNLTWLLTVSLSSLPILFFAKETELN
ncbi:uncharacterized protein LOC100595307 isoform X1 [Nomascus leucogenys]|uniref:uncharacterized protein LOC100595307 isoform X1 n=1 Tax=Nomascus leucogenys TaxID=61853 RepID=UPI00122D7D68|nr:uncharacterized protein LOC100595307 isoform X1 [Nomascus leucogenys]